MVAYSTTPSLATVIKSYENWLHYGLFVHEPLTTSVRNVLYTYVGLPVNPLELDQLLKTRLNNRLGNKGIHWGDKVSLFPPSGEIYIKNMNIPLLVDLIELFTDLPLPIKRNVERAKSLAISFRHENPKIFDKHTFDAKWQEGNYIVWALDYRYDSEALKTASLDPRRLSILYSILQYHFIRHNALKSQLYYTGTEDGESVVKASDQSQHEEYRKCKCLFILFIIL